MVCAIRFLMQVHSCFSGASSTDVTLHREYFLPFMPTIGMQFSEGDWEAQITELAFDLPFPCDTPMMESSRAVEVEAWVGEDRELYNAGLHSTPGRAMAEVVQDHLDSGWQVWTDLSGVMGKPLHEGKEWHRRNGPGGVLNE